MASSNLNPSSFVSHLNEQKFKCVVCKDKVRPPVKRLSCGHRLCDMCEDDLPSMDSNPRCPSRDAECTTMATIKECKLLETLEAYMKKFSQPTSVKSQVNLSMASSNLNPSSFVSHLNEQKFKCVVCKDKVRPPVKRLSCGHRLCDMCEDDLPSMDSNPRCPSQKAECKAMEPIEVEHDNETTSELQMQEVHRSNKPKECSSKFTLGFEHDESCSYREIARPNEGSSQDFQPSTMEPHLADCHIISVGNTQLHEEGNENIGMPSNWIEQESIGTPPDENQPSCIQNDMYLKEYDIRIASPCQGKLIWKISNYTQRKQDATAGRTLSLYSQTFFTSFYGYKMCARAYLNGDSLGQNTHLSLYFVLMRGDYDALLKWPFRFKITFALLDQSEPIANRKHITDTFRPDPTSRCFWRPETEMNKPIGCPRFCAHARVESEAYLKEDSIFVGLRIEGCNV